MRRIWMGHRRDITSETDDGYLQTIEGIKEL